MSPRSRARVQSIIDPAAPRGRRAGQRRPWYAPLLDSLRVVGAVQAWLILSLAYVVLMLPMGLIFRLLADPLRIRRRADTTWQPFTRQFDRLDEAREQS